MTNVTPIRIGNLPILLVRVESTSNFEMQDITGPAFQDASRARIVIASGDDGTAKILKDNTGMVSLEVVG